VRKERTALRVLIVDDEAPARAELIYMLQRVGNVETVDEAETVVDALALLQSREYDVVFLDIRMPGVNGLEAMKVINELPRRPPVVFVTAYDEHAVEAFEVAAVDYLLKPVAEVRLRRTLERIANPRGALQLAALEGPSPHQMRLRKLPVEHNGRTVLLRVADIRYISAKGDYAIVRTFDAEYQTRLPLAELCERLGPSGFLRVHRSYVVNLEHVLEVHPFFGGTYVLVMNDKGRSEVPVSRSSVRTLRAALGL